jgi:predicted esterase
MLIMMHGMGMCAKEFEEFIEDFRESMPWVQLVFPEASIKPVTYLGGKPLRRWFDIERTPVMSGDNHGGLLESVATVHDIIRRAEESGIPASRIVLAGFSQGAVMSLTAGLTYDHRLAGICSFSGWLPGGVLQKIKHAGTPIFMGHGEQDTLIPFSTGQKSSCSLKAAGCSELRFMSYANSAHQFGSNQHKEDLEKFMMSRIPEFQLPLRLQPPAIKAPKGALYAESVSTDAGSDRSDEDTSDEEYSHSARKPLPWVPRINHPAQLAAPRNQLAVPSPRGQAGHLSVPNPAVSAQLATPRNQLAVPSPRGQEGHLSVPTPAVSAVARMRSNSNPMMMGNSYTPPRRHLGQTARVDDSATRVRPPSNPMTVGNLHTPRQQHSGRPAGFPVCSGGAPPPSTRSGLLGARMTGSSSQSCLSFKMPQATR